MWDARFCRGNYVGNMRSSWHNCSTIGPRFGEGGGYFKIVWGKECSFCQDTCVSRIDPIKTNCAVLRRARALAVRNWSTGGRRNCVTPPVPFVLGPTATTTWYNNNSSNYVW